MPPSILVVAALGALATPGAADEVPNPAPAEARSTKERALGDAAASVGSESSAPSPTDTTPAAPAASDSQRVVVWVLEQGLSAQQARLLEALTIAELQKLDGLEALSPRDAAATAAATCVEGCLAQIAASLGTPHVVTVKVEVVHDSEVLTMKLLDVESAVIQQMTSRTVDVGEGALTVLDDAVREVFAGYSRRDDALPGVSATVASRWRTEPVSKWVFVGGVVMTTAALATSIAFGVLSRDSQNRFNQLAASDDRIDGEELMAIGQDALDQALVSNIGWGVTGAFAVATVLLGLYTDFGSDAVLEPILAPSGGGMAVHLRF